MLGGVSIQDSTAPLRRVYVRAPVAASADAWAEYKWRERPDTDAATAQHDAFRSALEAVGAEVIVGPTPVAGDIDDIYTYDPTLMTDRGVIALRPGKVGRRAEPAAMAADLEALGFDRIGSIKEAATAEGGDMFFLDPTTLLVGVGYRTNADAVSQLRALLPEIEVRAFDLPHLLGPSACLHLMSFISPLAPDLAVVYLPLMPVRLVQLLQERGVELVEVPEEEFEPMGPNVLALAPRVGLALEGHPETKRRMEAAGVTVHTYAGDDISRKGDGGPTCLTRPLERG